MIPKNFIDALTDRTAIEPLVQSYVSLKRAGNNLVGLCPFHSEKTPSFTVFPQGNNFYCFGCGTGGDPITFIRKVENLDYPDAVEFLAKRAGMTVPQDDRAPLQASHVERRRVLEMNKEAALFFHKALLSDIPGAKDALSYLTKKRALSMTTVTHFGLGFAPDNYQMLSDYLKEKGYTDEELTEGYLSFQNKKGGSLTDSFRNRVMFPIIDPSGNVIAFGGRVMDDSLPKYKNTSDTPAFKKSKHLFALNFAKSCCKESLILCEGYMDVISLHEAGFENAVATLGTAITQEQARIISRYTKRVIISYDMDEAGRKAADKAMRLFEEVGLEVKLLMMQGAKDPDEYIKKFGKDSFRKILDESDTKFEYNLARVLDKYHIEEPQQKIEAVKELCRMIAVIPSKAERDIYIHEVAQRFGVTVTSLRDDIDRVIRVREREWQKKASQDLQQKTMGFRDMVNPDFSRAPSLARCEETVLGLLLLFPEYREAVRTGKCALSEDSFYTGFARRVFAYALTQDDEEKANVNEVFSPDEVGRITKMKVNRMLLSENGNDVFTESIKALKQGTEEKRMQESGSSFDALASILKRKAEQKTDNNT